MPIYDPTPFLTLSDRRLISLLAQLVLQSECADRTSNYAPDCVDMTQEDGKELLELLEQFVESKRFRETEFLLENLFSGRGFNSKALRDIYLSWRKFHGKSRALATDQWELVLSRLGMSSRHYGGAPWYRKDATPMTLDYFLEMERKLLAATGISSRVQQLVIAYVRLQFGYIDTVRYEERALHRGQISAKPKSIIASLRKDRGAKIGIVPISTTKIAATMTIVIDLSTAYTTRDWSVASFMSVLAGAAPQSILD